jgi:hypothetical protein
MRKAFSKNFGIVSAWKKEKLKISKFVDAGRDKWNQRLKERGWNYQHGIGQQGRIKKKNKIKTLVAERSGKTNTLYMNKNHYYFHLRDMIVKYSLLYLGEKEGVFENRNPR